MRTTKTCQICGITFSRVHTAAKVPVYCSRACANKAPDKSTLAIRQKISLAHRGERHPRFKGGWVTKKDGKPRAYVWIDVAMRWRLNITRHHAPRARVVWLEAHPGETLTAADVIHHRNRDSLDDRPENLERLAGHHEHAVRHEDLLVSHNAKRGRLPDKPCEQCGVPIRPWKRFCSRACVNAFQSGEGNPNFGRPMSEQEKAHQRQMKRGKRASPETRAKMREAHLARWAALRS